MSRRLRRLAALGLALLLVTAGAVAASAAVMDRLHAGGRSLAGPVDAAIVLGSSVDPDGILHYSSRRRVAAGVALLRAGTADRLIVSGGAIESMGTSSAALMRDHALALGAPPAAVLVEDAARTTFENIRFSFALAEEAGLGRLALVTDHYHLPRAAALACYFGRCGVGLVAAPAFEEVDWHEIAHDIGRESLAWWYNLGKVALWSALGGIGISEERRQSVVS